MAGAHRPRATRSRRPLSPIETATVLAASVAFTVSVGYLGFVAGVLVGVPLFVAIMAVPVVRAVRRQNEMDGAGGRLPGNDGRGGSAP